MDNQKVTNYIEAINLIKAGDISKVDEELFKDDSFIVKVAEEFKDNKEILLKFMNIYKKNRLNYDDRCGILKYVNEDLKNDREFVLKAVEVCGADLEYVSDEFKNDKEVVTLAIENSQYGRDDYKPVLKYASEDLRSDKEFVITVLGFEAHAIEYLSDDLKNDKDVVFESLVEDESAYEFIGEDLKNNEEFLLDLIEVNEYILDSAITENAELGKNKDFAIKAIKRNPKAYNCLSEELKNDKELALLTSESIEGPEQISFWGEDIKNDIDISSLLIEKLLDKAPYFNNELEAMIKENDEIIARNQQKIDSARMSLVSKIIEQQKTIREQEKQISTLESEKTK